MKDMPPHGYIEARLNQMQDRFEEHINKLERKIDKFIDAQHDMRVQFEQIQKVHRNEKDIRRVEHQMEEIKRMIYRWSGGLVVGGTALSLILKYLI